MFHGDDGFSLARSSLAAVLSQPSTGMLAEEPPTTHSWDNGTSLVLLWAVEKAEQSLPLASWGHHSLGTNATAELDRAVEAKSFSCCHSAKFVLQRWHLTSLGMGLWCDQRALGWRGRHSQGWMSFWEAELHPTLGAFNNSKICKVRDRNLYSFLIFPPLSRQRPLRHGHLQGWERSSCVSKLSPSKSLGITALPGLSLWWRAFIPSQTAAQDSHLHWQSFQGFWTMHKDKEEPKVYTAEDTSNNFLFIMWSPTAVGMRLILTNKGYPNFSSHNFLGFWHDSVISLIACEKQHPLGTPSISLCWGLVSHPVPKHQNTELSCRKSCFLHKILGAWKDLEH